MTNINRREFLQRSRSCFILACGIPAIPDETHKTINLLSTPAYDRRAFDLISLAELHRGGVSRSTAAVLSAVVPVVYDRIRTGVADPIRAPGYMYVPLREFPHPWGRMSQIAHYDAAPASGWCVAESQQSHERELESWKAGCARKNPLVSDFTAKTEMFIGGQGHSTRARLYTPHLC